MNNKLASSTAIGYAGIFIAGWMVSIIDAGWFAAPMPHDGVITVMIVGGILVALAGIMSFFQGKTLEMTVFLGLGALFFSFALSVTTASGMNSNMFSAYDGWLDLVWAVFFACLWIASFGAGLFKNLFLLGLWILFLIGAISNWAMSPGIQIIAGYVSLVTALIAGYILLNEIISANKATSAE